MDIIEQLRPLLATDLDEAGLVKSKVDKELPRHETRSRTSREFSKYLVSVATHPIGLGGSVDPLNCKQEEMIAYIMDMFSLTDDQLKRMFKPSNEPGHTQGTNQLSVGPVKRHSWRPELRVRIRAPTSPLKYKLDVTKLRTRIYVFKKVNTSSTVVDKIKTVSPTVDEINVKHSSSPATATSNILGTIFKRFKLDPNILIRPVNEMRAAAGFHGSRPTTVVYSSGQKNSEGDIHLPIRRYYCEPRTAHIVKFEFWLDVDQLSTSFLDRYRRFVRRILFRRNWYELFKSKDSLYENEKEEFYGFINVDLSIDLSAYACKKIYPILSLSKRQINSCELIIEPRNRRLLGKDLLSNSTAETVSRQPTNDVLRSLQISPQVKQLVVKHIRLYFRCIVYQMVQLKDASKGEEIDASSLPESITFDNLLYIPAHTLLNQHRIQCNISLLENQTLRRIALLSLLMELDKSESRSLEPMKLVLTCLLHNEYLIAQRPLNECTMQEVDPFRDQSKSTLHLYTIDLEIVVFEIFITTYLRERIERWLMKPLNKSSTRKSAKLATLYGLKVFREASRCFEQTKRKGNLELISKLREFVDNIICELVFGLVKDRMQPLLINSKYETKKTTKTVDNNHREAPQDEAWLAILRDINRIDNEVSQYWSKRGLDGLINDNQQFINELNVFGEGRREKLMKLVEMKLQQYIK